MEELQHDNRRITSRQVRELCGNVSDMTLWRWLQQTDFPKPIYIGTRRYWREMGVIGWLNSRPMRPAPKRSVAQK